MTAPNISNPTHPAAAMNQVRLPRTAALGPGLGGQPRLLIDAPAGAAEIYLHGATVTSWVPRGGSEVIFTSRQAVFDGTTAIRGGIPLCLPEFGVGINGDAVPKHGWARIAPWQLRTVTSTDDGGVRALLSVSRDRLTALYEVEVGETLRVGLSLRNEGTEPRTVEAAAHTYLLVQDVTASLISGLDGASYSDNLARTPKESRCVQTGDVKISGPVDRIYDSAAPVTVTDPGHQRTIHIDKRNAPSTIVWNPWSTYSVPMPDMADDEFPTMVCVEAGAVRELAPTIEPGASWSMQVTLSVENSGM